MRHIDKLATMTDPTDIESALDKLLSWAGGGMAWTGDLSYELVKEVPEDHRIGVRLVTHTGSLSEDTYTYLVPADQDKPHTGSIVLVPNRSGLRGGNSWGVVQSHTPEPELGIMTLKYIVKWVHRNEV